jgi:hypothetical protein
VSVRANLTAAGGNILINGIADSVTDGLVIPMGVYITSTVSTTGSGTISLTGQSMNTGVSTQSTLGVAIGHYLFGGTVTSVNGDILINGTSGSGANSIAVDVYSNSLVQATGSGNVTLNGTAGNAVAAAGGSIGVHVSNASEVSTNSGLLTLNGVNTSTAGSNLYGVDVNGSGAYYAWVDSTSGAIRLIGTAVNGVGVGVLAQGASIGKATRGDILLNSLNGTGITLDTVAINTTGNLTLNATGGGAITQTNGSGSIAAAGLRVLGDSNATASLTSNTNHITALAGNLAGATATLSYTDSGAFSIASLTTDDTGTGVSTTTTGLTLGTATGNALTLKAGGNLSVSGTVSAGTFTLGGGTWNQISATLPSFTVNDFRITGGTFIRALGGNGSSATPYQLADIYGVQGMGSAGMLGNNYVLANNVDATGTSVWNAGAGFAPIGNASNHFTGTFDGVSHTLGNLSINRPTANYVGLFGYSAGNLRNMGLINAAITGSSYVGGLVGGNFGSISNSNSTGGINGFNFVGGLVGRNNSATISNSYAAGTVSGNGAIGGLSGGNWTGTVSNSYSTANVTGDGLSGGLVGDNAFNSVVTNSYATGIMHGAGSSNPVQIGGLVGKNGYGSSITNSYATGNVTGTGDKFGGLVGMNQSTCSVSNSYETGSVGGTTNVGGLVGYNYGGPISGYWNASANNLLNASSGGIGGGSRPSSVASLTATQMMQQASFTGWNIANTGGSGAVWRIYEGHTAPLLVSFLKPFTLTDAADLSVTYNGTAQSGATYIYPPVPGLMGTVASGRNAGTYNGYYSAQQGYDITGGNLTISPLAVSLTAPPVSKIYDGGLGYTSTGADLAAFQSVLAGGDTITAASIAYTDGNAGTNKTVNLNGVTLNDGNGGANYTLKLLGNSSSTINQLNSVTWVGASSGNWSLATNWAGGAIPLAANVAAVTIPQNVSVTYDSNVAGTTTLTTLTTNGTLTLTDGNLNIGAAGNQNPGTLGLGAGGSIYIAAGGSLATTGYAQNGGSLSGSGNFSVNQSFSQTGGSLALNNASIAITQASGNLNFTNTGILNIDSLTVANGNINLNNTGALSTTGQVSAQATNPANATVDIYAHSPLTIGLGGIIAGGTITLTAGATGGTLDILSINGSIISSNGNINLSAGNGINFGGTGSLSAPLGIISRQANLNLPPVPVPPVGTTSSAGTQQNEPTSPVVATVVQQLLKVTTPPVSIPTPPAKPLVFTPEAPAIAGTAGTNGNSAVTPLPATNATIGGTAGTFGGTDSAASGNATSGKDDNAKKDPESGQDNNKDKPNAKLQKC